jgi:uncharacterized protein (DUF305 family)
MTQQPNTAATQALKAANERMHHEMNIDWTGDPDRDFVCAMIPHHQGAIEMARVAIDHCSDPELRELAEKIIADQEKEIADMRDWLARHPA